MSTNEQDSGGNIGGFSGASPLDTLANRYEVIREIGRGGIGSVYLAQDQKLNRYVAIKRLLLQPNNKSSITVQRRFLREAQTIASLGHFHIVSIYDISKDDAGYYIAMEYVPGPQISDDSEDISPAPSVSLQQYVKEQGPIERDEATKIIVKLCSALDYAHHRNIIHRDIKPANILLDEQYEPKLVDFGLAKPIGRSSNQEITLEGEFVGTPEYVAPEQWSDGSEIDERVDIFALGGVFWFILTGEIPRYFRESVLPDELKGSIARALAHKRTDRFRTVKDFAAALESTNDRGPVRLTDDASDGDEVHAAEQWRCPNCQKFNPEAAKYCITCGTFGMEVCCICETEIRIGTQFCPNCGIDVKKAETAAMIIEEAKNQAEFMEYESALNTIKDLDNKHHPEALNLAKKWRQTVLHRRNMLTDLDSCIRVFNLEKAVNLYKDLSVMIPDECLSDSADFDVVVKYSSLVTELKELLRESATRAQEDYNLNKFTESIKFLNEVCGGEACVSINNELENINETLTNLVTKAGLALGMNCMSRALDILQAASPWKGSELGQRRNKMIVRCEELIKEREELIDNLEEAIRKGDYSNALQLIRETARFKLPPNYSEMEPDHDDLAAHDRIAQVDKMLMQKFETKIPDWVEQDSWEDIKNAFATLQGEEDSAWRKLNETLRNMINKKIASRYNDAVQLESKGRLSQAERAWKLFQSIPEDLAPAHLMQYANEYRKRKQSVIQSRMNRLIKRVVLALYVTWAYPLFRALVLEFNNPGGFDIQLLVPGLVNLGVFLILTMVLFSKKIAKAEVGPEGQYRPRRANLMFFLIAISPLSYVSYQLISNVAALSFQDLPTYVPLISIVFIWLIIDLFRRYRWQFKGAFSLSISWIILAAVVHLCNRFGLRNHALWPLVAALHGMMYITLLTIEHKVHDHASGAEDESSSASG